MIAWFYLYAGFCFVCKTVLTTRHVPPSPPEGGDGLNIFSMLYIEIGNFFTELSVCVWMRSSRVWMRFSRVWMKSIAEWLERLTAKFDPMQHPSTHWNLSGGR